MPRREEERARQGREGAVVRAICRSSDVVPFAGERADLTWQLAPRLRATMHEAGARPGLRRARTPARPGARRHRAGRRARRRAALGEQATRLDAELDDARRAHLRHGRRDVQHQLAEAARRRAVRQAEAAGAQAHRQGAHGVDGAGRARGAGARARSAARSARMARAAEAEGHLHRRAAAAGEPGDRPRAHVVQPGDGRHRALEQQRSEPAERADPHRGGPRDPPRVHRRARLSC